jgi:regulatory protein
MGCPRRASTRSERRAERAKVDDPAKVVDAALRYLEARPRSAMEVRRRLAEAGYRAELVAGAIERLAELGVLDDEAFARAWVESRDRARPRGERALSDELRRKGIDRETVTAALEDRRRAAAVDAAGSGDDRTSADEGAATRLMARNARLLERIADPRARRQRAYAILARHGFSPDVCSRIAATVVIDPTAYPED